MRSEFARREAIGALGATLRSSAGVAVGVLGASGLGINPLLYGGGAGAILGAVFRKASDPVSRMMSEMGAKALRPILQTTAKALPVAGRAVRKGSVDLATASNYPDLRHAVENAPAPEERIEELVMAGAEPEQAAEIAARQEQVLDFVRMAMPTTDVPPEHALVGVNAVLDALTNPAGVLERMRRLQVTPQDVEVLRVTAPEALREIREMIQAQYDIGGGFTVEQIAQHELLMGESIGIKAGDIQKLFTPEQAPQGSGGDVDIGGIVTTRTAAAEERLSNGR
jgi:hypothetical protein